MQILNGLSASGFIEQITSDKIKAFLTERCTSSRCWSYVTSGKDALTIFDVARILSGQIDDLSLVFIKIKEVGPFTGDEETELFNAYLLSHGIDNNITSNTIITFDEHDKMSTAIIIISMCMLFQWDFWLISFNPDLVIFHSHDVGLKFYSIDKTIENNLLSIGLLHNKL